MHTSTLTIRLPQTQRAALKETAERLNKSESELVRDLLAREFGQLPFGTRAEGFAGCLASIPEHPATPDPFRDAIKRNNWRPK
jgi:hypothetical protein